MTSSASTPFGWIVVKVEITGSLEDFGFSYYWLEGRYFATRKSAIRAGFRAWGHDDFNVAQIKNGSLVWWGWMDEEHPPEDRQSPAEALGFTFQNAHYKPEDNEPTTGGPS